jgi:tetratricopeptide (TPR) repeat protein
MSEETEGIRGAIMREIFSRLFLIGSVILCLAGVAQAKTFEREYTYRASEADSKITARSIALNQTKTGLLEEIGVYIESTFDDKLAEKKTGLEQLSQQQIVSITAGVTETKILDEKWDGQTYYMKAQITIDIDDVKKRIAEIAKDRDKTRDLEDVKNKADEAYKQIQLLQTQLAKTHDENEKLKLQKEYQQRSDELSAADYCQMGINVLNEVDAKMEPDQDAVLNAVHKQNPTEEDIRIIEEFPAIGKKYAEYYDRSLLYFQKAAELNPEFVLAWNHVGIYSMIGMVYSDLGNDDKAVEMHKKAISLHPENQEAYIILGQCYTKMDDYDKAKETFEKAISVAPSERRNLTMLQHAFGSLGQYCRLSGNNVMFIDCYKKAASLGDKRAQEYLNSQGVDW